ncbi:speckle-type POZ protein isoform X1 [Microplitis demolitor]|uniref:speckle-type POZ protein isoform X1 n=2 Tax=Microplitis demolitor TaxID=69319 RepID=UPI00235B6AA6|nr:speckle-type POZ protein isoform X1 [Microplitis demolitor]
MNRGYSQLSVSMMKHTIVFEWKVENIKTFIEMFKNSNECIQIYSPEFSAGAKMNDLWQLKLVLNDQSDDDYCISLYLIPLNRCNDQHKIKTAFSFFIVDDKGVKVEIVKFNRVFDKHEGWGLPIYKKEDLIKDESTFMWDPFTVGIELTVFDSDIMPFTVESLKKLKHSMVYDYNQLFLSKQDSDVILVVRDEEFQAHKSILKVRSPVFRAMFTANIKPNTKDRIKLPDMDPVIFNSILEFIYTDKVPDVITEELLDAAEKFQLELLKKICEEFFCESVSTENVVSMLILADKYNAKQLLEYSVEFIVSNAKSVIDTPAYNVMKKSYPSLMVLLFEKFADSK